VIFYHTIMKMSNLVMPQLVLCESHIRSDIKDLNILYSVPYVRWELVQRFIIRDE
jgi:hypothetical protein